MQQFEEEYLSKVQALIRTQIESSISTIYVEWDLHIQSFTLGGALTLRAEIELLAQFNSKTSGIISLINWNESKRERQLLSKIMNSSIFKIEIQDSSISNGHYPFPLMGYLDCFSYYSSRRMQLLCSLYSSVPELNWKPELSENFFLKSGFEELQFGVIHLKMSGPIHESRADI